MNASEIYWNGMFGIVALYKDSNDDFFVKFKSPCSVCFNVYDYLTRKKEIDPIEKLGEAEKREIWNKTSGTMEERIKQSKAIYLMRVVRNVYKKD